MSLAWYAVVGHGVVADQSSLVERGWPISSSFAASERVDLDPSSQPFTITSWIVSLNQSGAPTAQADFVIGYGPEGGETQIGTLSISTAGIATVTLASSTIPAAQSPFLKGPSVAVPSLSRFALTLVGTAG